MKKEEILELLQPFIEKVKPYWQTVAGILGAVIIFGALGIFFVARYTEAKKQAWGKISFAQGYVSQNMTDQAIQLLDDVINKYSNADVSQYARLLKADVSFNTGNYNLAASIYQQILEKDSPKTIVPFAYSGAGLSKENLGDYPGALLVYQQFIEKFPEHYLAPRIYDSIARVYILMGRNDEAQKTFEKIVTYYPGTYWASRLQQQQTPQSGATPPAQRSPVPQQPAATPERQTSVPQQPTTPQGQTQPTETPDTP
ncbi:MAG: tetratricopeptide repeat protein [Elusimicrobiota bacterium]